MQRTPRRPHVARRDRGVTLIEILIAVVLIGGVVAASMAALQATITGGAVHRDHSIAHGWLQSASDVLYAEEKINCDPAAANPAADRVSIIAAYEQVFLDVDVPNGWAGWQINIIDLQFWNGANLDADVEIEFFFAPTCQAGLELQLLTIQVQNPQHRVIETVEIVK